MMPPLLSSQESGWEDVAVCRYALPHESGRTSIPTIPDIHLVLVEQGALYLESKDTDGFQEKVHARPGDLFLTPGGSAPYEGGWAPIIAVQLEYSLRQRTVEGELIPMAQSLGLAVTPWSPLNNGVLTGKYTRQNAGTVKGDRGAGMPTLTEKDYGLIDTLGEIAHEFHTTIAAVALAWVQGRAGVTSTIIGARTLKQLEENLAALDLQLTPVHVARLDELSEPTLDFPSQIVRSYSSSRNVPSWR